MEVDGDLTVTGTIENDSLAQVIANLQDQITAMQAQINQLECLNNGIETHKVYQHIYENSTRSRIELMGNFLSNLNYELDGKLAWFVISKDMVKNANGTKSDVDGFTDMVRSISGVEVALMIFEQDEISCRINFRSKGNLIINDIANKMGGGGHAYAAGALVNGTLSEVTSKVVGLTTTSVKRKMKGN